MFSYIPFFKFIYIFIFGEKTEIERLNLFHFFWPELILKSTRIK